MTLIWYDLKTNDYFSQTFCNRSVTELGIRLSWVKKTCKIKICYNQPKLSKSLITVKIRITSVISLIMICSSRNWIIWNNQVIDLITYLNKNFKMKCINSLWSLWRSILKNYQTSLSVTYQNKHNYLCKVIFLSEKSAYLVEMFCRYCLWWRVKSVKKSNFSFPKSYTNHLWLPASFKNFQDRLMVWVKLF